MIGYELLADPGGWGHMAGGGMDWVLMTLVVLLVGWAIWLGARQTRHSDSRRRTAIDVLDIRYASGEIDKDEYLERKNTLEQ